MKIGWIWGPWEAYRVWHHACFMTWSRLFGFYCYPPPSPSHLFFILYRVDKDRGSRRGGQIFFCFAFWIIHPKFSKETTTNKMPLSHCAGSVRLHAGLALNVYSRSLALKARALRWVYWEN